MEKDLIHLRDGDVVLYHRGDNGIWWARFRYKVGTRTKWKHISTKTENVKRAGEIACERLDELRFKKGEQQANPFSVASKAYAAELETKIKAGTHKPADKTYLSWVKNWIDPFFIKEKGDISLDQIDDDVIEDWYAWQVNRPGPTGRKLAGEPLKKASVASINTAFTNIMELAKRKKWIKREHIPELKAEGSKTIRRPYFSIQQYQHLCRYMQDVWVKKQTSEDLMNRRLLLRDYVLFMANSGLRPGIEVDTLRYVDVSDYIDPEKNVHVVVKVNFGKTDEREVVVRPNVRSIIKRIRGRNKPAKETDFIFRLPDGSKIKELRALFVRLLTDCGLREDHDGIKRTLYSLRHTYATFRLLYGGVDYKTLADNMGTSVAMIEKHYSHLETRMKAAELAGNPYRNGIKIRR